MTQPVSNGFFSQNLATVPIVLILRNLDPMHTRELARMAWDFGVHLVEVPIASPHSWASLEAVIDEASGPKEFAGAGSVINLEQAAKCQAAGASFLVSPGFSSDLAEFSLSNHLPWLPGVATGTEIMAARNYGFEWLKAFPAGQLGQAWIKAQLDPFPDVRFVATGGVSAQNAREWTMAGAQALGVGSGAASQSSLTELIQALR
jgi:2-dehydro-3-deoxyphosphogluconate aldolase/(4S)-4-hydroxy-2-oxoglutarate aldolase